jgi:hypothetical protein
MTAMPNLVATGISNRGPGLKTGILQTVEVAGQTVYPPTTLLLFPIAVFLILRNAPPSVAL